MPLEKNEAQNIRSTTSPTTPSNQDQVSVPTILKSKGTSLTSRDAQNDENEIPEKDRKAHVDPYEKKAEFPFETNEIVWIKKPEHRTPMGEFRIVQAHPNDKYELVRCSDNTLHSELIEGKHLLRNP
ncbi:hypothetical protein MMC07_008005 [Pseudocyphellaria aurata]|nr:hypothetical protein [Pseudocyphellaria aurata]